MLRDVVPWYHDTHGSTLDSGPQKEAYVFRSIVIALDLEREGDRSLPIARSLSAATEVSVDLLTVQSPNMSSWIDEIELRRRADAHGWPDATCTVLQSNDPAGAIANYAGSRPGSLLVMSTSAKSPLKQQFLGSVSEAVLSHVQGPVLLVGPRVPEDADMSRPALVVCVDSIDTITRARPVVTAWMNTFSSAPPRVVEVVPAHGHQVTDGGEDVESAHPKQLTEQLETVGIDASWEILHGVNITERLEEFAATINDPVLVVASTNWTDDRTHWHSTTRRLVQRAKRPVLVIPDRRQDARHV